MDRIFNISENIRKRIPISPYLFAVLVVVLGIIAREIIHPELGVNSQLLIFSLSVLLAGWYGGLKPVIMATFLSTVAGYIFFTEPVFQLSNKGYDDNIRFLIFSIQGIMIGLITESRLRHEKKIELLLKATVTSKRKVEKNLLFRDHFISIASHELKTPLTTASLILQVLHRKTKNKKNIVYLNNLKSQLDKLNLLISDFLDISKIQNGKLQIQNERLDLNIIAREVVKLMRLSIKSHKIYLRGKVSGHIMGDGGRISQVMVNLMTNAVKYSPKNSKIVIFLKDLKSSVTVSVRDYGIGIEPENQEKIFKRFFRVEGKNEHIFRGFGIGLYICSEIVKRHKGDIWVESEINKGSTFSFSLPKI